MVIGKIKPTATIVAQFAAGVEVDAIQHEGKMFLPVVAMGEFASKEPAPEKPAKSAPAKEAPAKEEAPEESRATYTEDELMEMDSKVLVKLLKDEYGIDPSELPGKNTNKKLRDLILKAQEGDVTEKNDDEEESDDAEESDETTLADKVADLLDDFDAGKKNRKKTTAAILALSEDADEEKVSELITEFEDDADADIDEVAQKIADILEGKSAKKASKKTEKKSKKSKKDEEEELVEVEDLEVGDRVSVWWDDDNQDWYDGTVKSIKKGKVVIEYDDDTEDAIDPEVHTKIKRLAD